ncbi:hypothetical protein K501DRAFT_273089 [Backusella circina FSU 941]|nr:hypothetical protein K501DRAFT_273089 [Backusella circina FSU 941]
MFRLCRETPQLYIGYLSSSTSNCNEKKLWNYFMPKKCRLPLASKKVYFGINDIYYLLIFFSSGGLANGSGRLLLRSATYMKIDGMSNEAMCITMCLFISHIMMLRISFLSSVTKYSDVSTRCAIVCIRISKMTPTLKLSGIFVMDRFACTKLLKHR